jgi:hypothetical protein
VLINDGTGQFTTHPDLLGIYQHSLSTAQIGDFNQDGYLDIFAARHNLYNNPGPREDIVLLNPYYDNGNNFIRFQILDSAVYRMDGIQVRAQLFSQHGMQTRTLRVGESYGVCGSNILHFGLGSDPKVDSVVFEWPGGDIETYYPQEVNELYLYTRGTGIRKELVPSASVLCITPGDSVQLDHIDEQPRDLTVYRNEVEISYRPNEGLLEPGRYFWVGRDDSGAWIRNKPMILSGHLDVDTRLTFEGQQDLCHNEIISLRPADPARFLYWNTGKSQPELFIDKEGLYRAAFSNCQDTVFSDSLSVSIRSEISISAQNDTVARGERAVLRASGNQVYWYEDIDDITALQSGSSIFLINSLERDTVFYVASRQFFERPNLSLGPTIDQENAKAPNPWFNPAMEFSVLSDCQLKEITVRAAVDGERSFVLSDFNGQILQRYSTSLEADSNYRLPLNWTLEQGNDYILSTDASVNFDEFNVSGPQLYQPDLSSVHFPYSDGEFLSITGTNGGLNEFYSFTNWVIEVPPDTCFSERIAVRGIVEQSVSDELTGSSENISRVYPNPAQDHIFIWHHRAKDRKLEVFSIDGKRVYDKKLSTARERISTAGWPTGLYLFNIHDGEVLKQHSIIIEE